MSTEGIQVTTQNYDVRDQYSKPILSRDDLLRILKERDVEIAKLKRQLLRFVLDSQDVAPIELRR